MWLKQNAYKLPRVLRSCLVYKLLHIPVNELEKKENYLLNQFFYNFKFSFNPILF